MKGARSSWRVMALVVAVVVGSLGAADGQGLRGQEPEQQGHVPARSAADMAMDAADKTRIRCDVLDSNGASAGHFTLELVRSWSPKGVERMVELVRMRWAPERRAPRIAPPSDPGPAAASRRRPTHATDSRCPATRYYDGAVFFRALKNFVVQWGMRSKVSEPRGGDRRRIVAEPTPPIVPLCPAAPMWTTISALRYRRRTRRGRCSSIGRASTPCRAGLRTRSWPRA